MYRYRITYTSPAGKQAFSEFLSDVELATPISRSTTAKWSREERKVVLTAFLATIFNHPGHLDVQRPAPKAAPLTATEIMRASAGGDAGVRKLAASMLPPAKPAPTPTGKRVQLPGPDGKLWPGFEVRMPTGELIYMPENPTAFYRATGDLKPGETMFPDEKE